MPQYPPQNFPRIQKALLDWFASHQRSFPWRNTSNPFHILLAEKLLQQTKARHAVVAIYTHLLAKYPAAQDLMKASDEELYRIIRPLGLAYRAAEMKQMAKEIVELYGGDVPASLDGLLALTGVGDYCARAVLCFAYNRHIPIVDTNVARFLHRLYGIADPLPSNPARKKYLRHLASDLLPTNRARDFNLAVLDLCAMICTPRNPKCHICPVQEFCVYGQAARSHSEDSIPGIP